MPSEVLNANVHIAITHVALDENIQINFIFCGKFIIPWNIKRLIYNLTLLAVAHPASQLFLRGNSQCDQIYDLIFFCKTKIYDSNEVTCFVNYISNALKILVNQQFGKILAFDKRDGSAAFQVCKKWIEVKDLE